MRVARNEESNSTDLETLQDRFLVPPNDKKLTESQNFLSKICHPERNEGYESRLTKFWKLRKSETLQCAY